MADYIEVWAASVLSFFYLAAYLPTEFPVNPIFLKESLFLLLKLMVKPLIILQADYSFLVLRMGIFRYVGCIMRFFKLTLGFHELSCKLDYVDFS